MLTDTLQHVWDALYYVRSYSSQCLMYMMATAEDTRQAAHIIITNGQAAAMLDSKLQLVQGHLPPHGHHRINILPLVQTIHQRRQVIAVPRLLLPENKEDLQSWAMLLTSQPWPPQGVIGSNLLSFPPPPLNMPAVCPPQHYTVVVRPAYIVGLWHADQSQQYPVVMLIGVNLGT